MTAAAKTTKTKPFEPKVVAFLCNWCSYAGADLCGVSRFQYPPNMRVIRVMCSGSVNPLYILRAFQSGADAVLVSGCQPGDCHYLKGNLYARRRFALLRNLLSFIGVDPRRFQVSWVSASEGDKFAAVVKEVIEEARALGPQTRLKRRV
jgi:F420-non-reducing hydrogenase iron-sulfur subunit